MTSSTTVVPSHRLAFARSILLSVALLACSLLAASCGGPKDASGTMTVSLVGGGSTHAMELVHCALVPGVLNLHAEGSNAASMSIAFDAASNPMRVQSVSLYPNGRGAGMPNLVVGTTQCPTFTGNLTRTGTGPSEVIAGDISLSCANVPNYLTPTALSRYNIAGQVTFTRCTVTR